MVCVPQRPQFGNGGRLLGAVCLPCLGGTVSASCLNAIILVLPIVCSSSLLVMSSDPFIDLASSTEAFAKEFREFMTRNPQPAPGSPADKEAQGELLAGDWSEHPSGEIFATTYLTATSLIWIGASLASRRSPSAGKAKLSRISL